jgi:hypothetical protein
MTISNDQNTLEIGGITTTFYPVKRVKKNRCHHCFIFRHPDACGCVLIPCNACEREDGKSGVFSIREMPKPRKVAGYFKPKKIA